MKKLIVISLCTASLVCLQMAISEETVKTEAAQTTSAKAAAKKTSATKVKAAAKVVPAGRTFVVLDAKGKEVKRFSAGETAALGTDCVMVKCPGSFESDVTCWKCVESLTN